MIEVSYVVFWTSFWKLKLIKLHDLQGQYEPWRLLMRRKYQTLLVIKILSEKDYWQTRNLTRFIKTNSQYCRFRQVKHKPTVTSFRTKIWAKFNEVSRKNYVNRQEGGIATATEITHSAEIRRKIILDIGLDLSCRRAQKKAIRGVKEIARGREIRPTRDTTMWHVGETQQTYRTVPK